MTGEKCVEGILNTVDVDFEMIDGTMAHKAVTHLIKRITELEEERDKLGGAVAHMGAIFDSGKGTDAEKIEEVIAHFQTLALPTNSKGES